MTSLDFDSSIPSTLNAATRTNPTTTTSMNPSYDFDESMASTPMPSAKPPTNFRASQSSSTSATSYEDSLISFIEEKDGNKYYRGFKRSYKSDSGDQENEQLFWIGDFVQFSIEGGEAPSSHEGRISSLYSCTFMGNIKKCKVQMLHQHSEVVSSMGVLCQDINVKKDPSRRFITNLEGEIPLSTITGRVFVVNSAKELKERCGYYVENDSSVNTIDNDAYSKLLYSNNTNSTNNILNKINSDPVKSFMWAMRDNSQNSSVYSYYTSCILNGIFISVGNLCTLEVAGTRTDPAAASNPQPVILIGRISKMFEDKTNTQQQWLAVEEVVTKKGVSSMSFSGLVKTIPIEDILNVKKHI